mmetsp:Transcript_12428/g.22237  ORF Transcript_12428/g.22237 Transcript_12428/m.22237 type:complete len:166 (-) Transcript_12428:74-571(-)
MSTFLKNFAWCLPAAIAFTDLVGCILQVEGNSMQPTLNADPDYRDWVLVEKISYKWLHRYSRGDVAVMWAPDEPHQQIVKRIVGLEFDVIWDEEDKRSEKIPQGRCWVEGDNRAESGDSRNLYGPVHLGLLEGRVTHVVWPPWRIGSVPQVYQHEKVILEHKSSS